MIRSDQSRNSLKVLQTGFAGTQENFFDDYWLMHRDTVQLGR